MKYVQNNYIHHMILAKICLFIIWHMLPKQSNMLCILRFNNATLNKDTNDCKYIKLMVSAQAETCLCYIQCFPHHSLRYFLYNHLVYRCGMTFAPDTSITNTFFGIIFQKILKKHQPKNYSYFFVFLLFLYFKKF